MRLKVVKNVRMISNCVHFTYFIEIFFKIINVRWAWFFSNVYNKTYDYGYIKLESVTFFMICSVTIRLTNSYYTWREEFNMAKQQIGVIGLAVMGKNLALNIESRGYSVSVYNRSPEKTEEFLKQKQKVKILQVHTVWKSLLILLKNRVKFY